MDELVVSMRADLAILRNSCEELLSPLILPDKLLFELLEQCGETSWDDKDLQRKLAERLGDSQTAYMSATRQLRKRIELFARKLDLGEDFKVGISSPKMNPR